MSGVQKTLMINISYYIILSFFLQFLLGEPSVKTVHSELSLRQADAHFGIRDKETTNIEICERRGTLRLCV